MTTPNMRNAADHTPDESLVLVTGATGCVGGRLLRSLQAERRRVRCLARRPEFLRA